MVQIMRAHDHGSKIVASVVVRMRSGRFQWLTKHQVNVSNKLKLQNTDLLARGTNLTLVNTREIFIDAAGSTLNVADQNLQ